MVSTFRIGDRNVLVGYAEDIRVFLKGTEYRPTQEFEEEFSKINLEEPVMVEIVDNVLTSVDKVSPVQEEEEEPAGVCSLCGGEHYPQCVPGDEYARKVLEETQSWVKTMDTYIDPFPMYMDGRKEVVGRVKAEPEENLVKLYRYENTEELAFAFTEEE